MPSDISAPMEFTLVLFRSAALTINSFAASGDFAATSTGANACPMSPATLAAGANCTINVTFTPTASGARTGTLLLADNRSEERREGKRRDLGRGRIVELAT